MLSGGRDSVCLLDVCASRCAAPRAVRALHVNYGLRARGRRATSATARELCEQLGVELRVVRAPRARRARASRATCRRGRATCATRGRTRLAAERDALIATGHTATDQVETILYRLAASPGRRALLGMAARDGRLVRPLLGVTREQTAAYCRARGLRWREDASNDDDRFARARVRTRLVPALRAVHPAAEANVLRTARAAARGDRAARRARRRGARGAATRSRSSASRQLPPALARLVVVRLAEQAAAGLRAAGRRARATSCSRWRAAAGAPSCTSAVSAGAVIEHGVLAMRSAAAARGLGADGRRRARAAAGGGLDSQRWRVRCELQRSRQSARCWSAPRSCSAACASSARRSRATTRAARCCWSAC